MTNEPEFKACMMTDCESYPEELSQTSEGNWICQAHAEEAQALFESQARLAMSELGLPDDEAEQMLEDYQFEL